MEFNAKSETYRIIDFIQEYYYKNNLKGAVIGISGGKDSAVVASLFTKALGPDNVVGLWLPIGSKDEDYQDAKLLCDHLNIPLKEFSLDNIYHNYVSLIKERNDVNDHNLIDANINIKPRLRMLTLYYYAAMLSSINRGTYLVAGTSNKSECYVGYFTKGGDNVSDINVISDLYADEVVKLGDYLGVPHHIAHKIPSDGLQNLSDEERLGVSYDEIKKAIIEEETGVINPNLSEEQRIRVRKMHRANLHKFNIPSYRR